VTLSPWGKGNGQGESEWGRNTEGERYREWETERVNLWVGERKKEVLTYHGTAQLVIIAQYSAGQHNTSKDKTRQYNTAQGSAAEYSTV
jgi:hypothetical protein